jgi:hypothetical protein
LAAQSQAVQGLIKKKISEIAHKKGTKRQGGTATSQGKLSIGKKLSIACCSGFYISPQKRKSE